MGEQVKSDVTIDERFNSFAINRTGADIKDLIKLRKNKMELHDRYLLTPVEILTLDLLLESLIDTHMYSMNLYQMALILGPK